MADSSQNGKPSCTSVEAVFGAGVAQGIALVTFPAAGSIFTSPQHSLAGLGCSAMLPLIISFGQKSMPTIAPSVAGLLIAIYQLGYGVAAFGVGPLESMASLSLNHIFAATAVPAIGLVILAAVLSRKD